MYTAMTGNTNNVRNIFKAIFKLWVCMWQDLTSFHTRSSFAGYFLREMPIKWLWKMFIVECGLLYTKLNHFSVCLPEKKNSNQPQQSHKKGKKAFPTLYLVVSVLVVVVWLLQLSKGIHYSVFFMRNAVIKVLSRAKSWLGNVKKTHSLLEELLVNPNWCL